MEFITPKEDPVKLDDDGNINQKNSALGGNDDGLVVIPDIPRSVK